MCEFIFFDSIGYCTFLFHFNLNYDHTLAYDLYTCTPKCYISISCFKLLRALARPCKSRVHVFLRRLSSKKVPLVDGRTA